VGALDFADDAQGLLRARPVNVVTFKVSYWLNP
jgi:hypothetical protein